MREKLKEALLLRFPEMKDYIAVRCVSKYIDALLPELIYQYMTASRRDLEEGEIDLSENTVNESCGRMKLDGTYKYIYSLMQEHPSTSLVIVTYKGNSLAGRVSRVTFNQNYKRDIMEAITNLTIELNPDYLDELDAKANASWSINVESLASYIEATRTAIDRAPNKNYEDKLARNLRLANEIVNRCKEQEGEVWIDEYWEQIDSGRINGYGISLQRIPREVRHAALGHCHKYDFKAASYALMTSLALQLDPTLKVAALKDYIKHRSVIRKRIAADVGISEDWMKSIFTSLGFGADLKDNPFSSIRSKIGQEKFAKLVGNAEFALIKNALDQVTDTINKHFPNETFELHGRTYSQINPKDGRKRTKNQKLAWIYQCMESHAMSLFVQFVPDGYKTMLMVHDCIYLDRKLPAQHIADIKWKLAQAYPLLNFEHEEIFPIHAERDHGKQEREIVRAENEHKRFIAEQELQAASYRSLYTEGNRPAKRMVQTPWGAVEAELWEQVAPKPVEEDAYFKDSY